MTAGNQGLRYTIGPLVSIARIPELSVYEHYTILKKPPQRLIRQQFELRIDFENDVGGALICMVSL